MVTLNTEIRKLPADQLSELQKILNEDDCWKKVMAVIPKYDNPNESLFRNEHVTIIEQTVKMQQRTAAEIFLTEWSSMGKRRPTCSTLLDLLIKTSLFRAADYLAVEVLKIDRPERPRIGPAAKVDISDNVVEALLKEQIENALKIEKPNNAEQTWAMQYEEKLIGIKANAENTDNSDLIKFESKESQSKKSDLIEFSKSMSEVIEQLPKDMSNLINFNSEISTSNVQTEDLVLPEARSENIPLCVKDDMFQSHHTISSDVKSNSVTGSSINSSDISRTTDTEEEFDLPQVSQRLIPVVVFECTDDKSES